MEPGKRAVVLAAVIAYMRSREWRRRRQRALDATPVSAWRLARALDVTEDDALAQW